MSTLHSSYGRWVSLLALFGYGPVYASDAGVWTFNATIVAQTCSLDTDAVVVELPHISASALGAAGSTAGDTPTTLRVSGCAVTGPNPLTQVTFTFLTNPDADDPALFAQTGSARGVGLQLLNAAGNVPIDANNLNNAASVAIQPNATAELPLIIRYARNGAAVTAGDVTAVVQFDVSYL
jgi:major type 1 subunit fimbrin (pilin)